MDGGEDYSCISHCGPRTTVDNQHLLVMLQHYRCDVFCSSESNLVLHAATFLGDTDIKKFGATQVLEEIAVYDPRLQARRLERGRARKYQHVLAIRAKPWFSQLRSLTASTWGLRTGRLSFAKYRQLFG